MKADQNYNQKATDSLLNFETVKYFNAEKHEEIIFTSGTTEAINLLAHSFGSTLKTGDEIIVSTRSIVVVEESHADGTMIRQLRLMVAR